MFILFNCIQKLNHPNIIRCLWWDYADAELKIGLELATGGDLRRIIREHYDKFCLVREPIVWSCTLQLSSALYHMHKSRIMHRGTKDITNEKNYWSYFYHILSWDCEIIRLGASQSTDLLIFTNYCYKTDGGKAKNSLIIPC